MNMVTMPTIKPEIDCEDAATLILFIDNFLPLVDVKDPNSQDVAKTIFEVRNIIHQSMPPHLAEEMPKGVSPL